MVEINDMVVTEPLLTTTLKLKLTEQRGHHNETDNQANAGATSSTKCTAKHHERAGE
jgi:hypothetical protein